MDLVKKLAIGTATVSLAVTAFMTPVFADATATNDSTTGNPDVTATDNHTVKIKVKSVKTKVKNKTVVRANSGENVQMFNDDGVTMTVAASSAVGTSNTSVNSLSIVVY